MAGFYDGGGGAFRLEVEHRAYALAVEVFERLERLVVDVRDDGFWAVVFEADEREEFIVGAFGVELHLRVLVD